MAAIIEFVSTNGGTFTFIDLPLITRSVEYKRSHETGPAAMRRINVVLSGFFTGDDHEDIVQQYESLKSVLADSIVNWEYNDGSNEIANGQIRVQSYSEPSDWKQYDGNYTISFYYFEKQTANNPYVVSIVTSGGTLTLSPTPKWSRKIKPNKSGTTNNTATPFGRTIGSDVSINLEGYKRDSNLDTDKPAAPVPADIFASEEEFTTVLGVPGTGAFATLNYGPFSESVYIEDWDFSAGMLQDYFDYKISMKYYTEAVMKLSAKISFPRIHNNPKVTERAACGDRLIEYGNLSSQLVSYSVKLSADTLPNARSLLADELSVLIFAGGIEWPGGNEEWDYDSNTVSVTIKKFHDIPILSNL